MTFTGKDCYGIEDLLKIMELLRAPGGCPWDREQTHESIRRNLIEETYEAVEAIDNGDAALLQEELGDVLLQVVFHARMEEEKGGFSFADICDGICKKLILRHPHIFGDVEAETTEQVLENWDAIKKREKRQETQGAVLRSVPKVLPALLRAEKVQSKAAKSGFGFRDDREAMADLRGELDELSQAMTSGSREEISGELGDVLFAAANLARHLKLDPEECLTRSTDRFISRFETAESLAGEREIRLENADQDMLHRLWQEAKNKDDTNFGR